MKKVELIEGVVAEYNGKFWGKQYGDSRKDFGDLERAEISDPKYCTKPTDMVRNSEYNYEHDKLKRAKLLMVKKTITIEILS